MSNERTYAAWVYCAHPVFWYQGYWCCRDEQCEYRYQPVPTEGDGSFGHGGATAHDESRDNHQPNSQLDQDAYQYYAQRYGGYQNGYYQQDDVGQGGYGYPPNTEQPVPPSDAATTGSGSSATQTHSPSSTETPDNEDASMAGNADEYTEDREERTRSYVQDGNRGGQGVDDALILFPKCPAGDTRYPRKLSFGNESESGVDQFNIEERPDLGPR